MQTDWGVNFKNQNLINMKTTLTITTPKGELHLVDVQNGVIESTPWPHLAKQFTDKAEAVQFSKQNNILAWRATENE